MPLRPAASEYAPFYASYVSHVPEDDILRVLAEQTGILRNMTTSIPEDRQTYRYAPGKWSIREVLGHIGDVERVIGYRAFFFSRGGEAAIPGFDENTFVKTAGFDRWPLATLLQEFAHLREANLATLRSLDDAAWQKVGMANNNPVSVRALAYILAGHVRHHLAILRERYGVSC